MKERTKTALLLVLCAALLYAFQAIFTSAYYRAYGKDDGRYANSPLKKWFDSLASKKGLCCSFADGVSLSEVDWELKDGHYRVSVFGQWVDVPPDALVTVPNKFGRAVVWPYKDSYGKWQIRCFIPGALT